MADPEAIRQRARAAAKLCDQLVSQMEAVPVEGEWQPVRIGRAGPIEEEQCANGA